MRENKQVCDEIETDSSHGGVARAEGGDSTMVAAISLLQVAVLSPIAYIAFVFVVSCALICILRYAHPVRRMMERLVVPPPDPHDARPWASMAIDQWLITPLYMALCSMAVAVGHMHGVVGTEASGVILAFVIAHRFFFTMPFMLTHGFNIFPEGIARVSADKRRGDFRDLPKYVVFGGALGLADGPDFIMKVEMQRYLHEGRWSEALVEDFAALRTASRKGELGVAAATMSCKLPSRYVRHHFEAVVILSMLWRVMPFSELLLKGTFTALRWQAAATKRTVAAFAAEVSAYIYIADLMLSPLFDEVELQGKLRFTSISPHAPVVLDGEKSVRDARHRYIFGDHISFCPGRFFVSEVWLQQPELRSAITKLHKQHSGAASVIQKWVLQRSSSATGDGQLGLSSPRLQTATTATGTAPPTRQEAEGCGPSVAALRWQAVRYALCCVHRLRELSIDEGVELIE